MGRKKPIADLRERLASRVRDERSARGLSHERLAEVADISADAVARIERGERSPTLETVARLAHGFGMEPEDLLARPSDDETSAAIKRIADALRRRPLAVQEAAATVVLAFLRSVDETARPKPR